MNYAIKLCLGAALLMSQAAAAAPLAQGHDKFLGGIFAPSQIEGFTNYFNQVTPENAGKWGAVNNDASKPDDMYLDSWFTGGWHGGLDNAFNLAKNNGFVFRMHVLVWGNQQPQWIANLPPNEQLDAIHEWFDALAARYNHDRGGFDYIEVVNEPVNDPPNEVQSGGDGGNYINALGGEGETGWDWALEAFRMARTYFPDSKLMVNEYNVVNNPGVLNSYMELIDLLHQEGLLDAIGVQGHAFSTGGSMDGVRSHLDQLAEFGLPIYVTELDIDGANDRTQLLSYRRIFPTFWEHPAVAGVTLWGFRPGMWRSEQRAFLIDEDGNERPALHWLRCYLQCDQVTVIPGQALPASEDSPSGRQLGEVVAHSPNGDITNWEIVGASTDPSLFTISAGGMLSIAGNACLDYAQASSHELQLVAHDSQGASEPEVFTVNVLQGNGSCVAGATPPGSDVPRSSSSGGAFGAGFLLILLALLAVGLPWYRRRD